MHVGPLVIGLVMATLSATSLVETVGRGSAAAVAVYHRRAIATSAAFGLVGMLGSAGLSMLS